MVAPRPFFLLVPPSKIRLSQKKKVSAPSLRKLGKAASLLRQPFFISKVKLWLPKD